MLGLSPRPEFQGKRLQGTAIELANDKVQGATQVPAADFLKITSPRATFSRRWRQRVLSRAGRWC